LACCWIIKNCLQYPESRWFIGRDRLNSILKSTYNTFKDICKAWGVVKDGHYNINLKDGIITFFNGSEIYLLDLHDNPADSNFDRLGSMEFTGGFLEEVAQISRKAKDIIMSRIRYKLDEFGLIPKILIASNPTKNWVYYDFYLLWKAGQLKPYQQFIPAFVTDNPHISPHYIENLHKLENVHKQRLLYGNFEYDDDESTLMDYDSIIDLWTNTIEEDNTKYMTVDIARSGKDRTVFMFWRGLDLYKIITYSNDRRKYPNTPQAYTTDKTKFTTDMIKEFCTTEKIPRSQVIVDEDGVGGPVKDHCRGIKGFINNSSAFVAKSEQQKHKRDDNYFRPNYRNLKSQCAWMLAKLVNTHKIRISADMNSDTKREIISELEQFKQHNLDKDQALQLIPKDLMKEALGRSPDFADALNFRMWFELKQTKRALLF